MISRNVIEMTDLIVVNDAAEADAVGFPLLSLGKGGRKEKEKAENYPR